MITVGGGGGVDSGPLLAVCCVGGHDRAYAKGVECDGGSGGVSGCQRETGVFVVEDVS